MSYWNDEEQDNLADGTELSGDLSGNGESEENLELDENEALRVLNDASLRLEQGSLYKMLLTNDIFSGVDADPRAISAVKRELRFFAKNRLEILVGIKRPQGSAEGFTSEEVFLLKKMLGKVMSNEKPIQETRPLLHKTSSLKPIQNASNKPLEKKPDQQINKNKSTKKNEEVGSRLIKPVDKMTDQELRAHNELVAKEQASRKVKPVKGAIPMPDNRQLEKLYTMRVQTSNDGGLVQAVMGKMNKQISLSEDVGDGSGGSFDPNERF